MIIATYLPRLNDQVTNSQEISRLNIPCNASLPAGHSTRVNRIRFLAGPICLGLVCLLVYNANFRQIGCGDTLAARYLPLGIWRYGTLRLDRIANWVGHGYPIRELDAVQPKGANYVFPYAYWIVHGRHNHLVSFYPVVTPLLVSPLYLPAVIYLHHHKWEQPWVDWVTEAMEKLAASVLAAVASVFVYLLVRRDAGRWGLALTLAFAFGTNTWMISSQALWQHGAAELLIALALLLAVSRPTPARVAALGAVCIGIAGNRPPDALIAGSIAFWSLWTRRSTAWWLLAGAAVPFAALLFYNIGVIGRVAGGYGTVAPPLMRFFQYPALVGLAGLMISPTRGLLVFSPFLAFVPCGFLRRLREPGARSLALALGLAVCAQLLLYSRMDWRAGNSWGPRYLTDVLPILVWLLAPAVPVLRALDRGILMLVITVSISIQAIGAFWYTGESEAAIFAGDPNSMKAGWDPRNTPFIAELRHPHADGELFRAYLGTIERVGSKSTSTGNPLILTAGTTIEGWALAGGETPGQVFLIVDGILIGSTQKFVPRPDIGAIMHTTSASGWRVSADLRGVPPGEHVLQLVIPLPQKVRVIREQRVIVVPAETPASTTKGEQASGSWPLNEMARRAASRLRERQSPSGYWLTAFTPSTRFESSEPEMNTFLTSIMIDFLSPIAREHGLEDVVQRARRHLGAQIENNGLVRYHGLPDGPMIGELGVVITPDADDTALAWRIANPGAADPRRNRTLEELAHYRDERGLYRTWLAPVDEYQSIDPGRNPNPVDATIQMHLYLMLRDLEPLAAPAFCSALQNAIGDEGLWVYYSKAPLIPYLRSAELRKKGCAIPIPTDRLARVPAGQEIWSEAARRLVSATQSALNSEDQRAIIALLERLARDNFAELRRNPPLLYHNDLTAKVSRYYWSEDFGYVLWLRLNSTITPANFSTS